MKEIIPTQMTNTTKVHNPGFEVHQSNGTGVVFKRVIPPKGRKTKELYKIEMGLPKVTMLYFSDEELSRLREIEEEISGKIIVPKKGVFEKVVHGLRRIIAE